MSAALTAPLVLEQQVDGWRLLLSGDWSLTALPNIEAQLKSLPAELHGILVCDWTQAQAPGIGPAWALLRRLAEACDGAQHPDVRHTGNPPHFLELLQKLHVDRHSAYTTPEPPTLERLVGKLGKWAVLQGRHGRGVIVFLGRIAAVIGEIFPRPRALRISSLARHIYETGITAIPIVSLIAFLISVIVAYLGAQQLARFGADIFVVDLVTIATLREMGVLLTAIIVAGRSGSAYAAQIGTMTVTEEIDAMRTLGIAPLDVLVLPKIFALLIALPLLTVYADVLGVFGGMIMARAQLGVGYGEFLDRLVNAIQPSTYWLGVVKAPVFAAIIAVVGCFQGFLTHGGADSVGRQTTRAVVQAIFLVIVADALFSILFSILDF